MGYTLIVIQGRTDSERLEHFQGNLQLPAFLRLLCFMCLMVSDNLYLCHGRKKNGLRFSLQLSILVDLREEMLSHAVPKEAKTEDFMLQPSRP
jgi:hypothetical protein